MTIRGRLIISWGVGLWLAMNAKSSAIRLPTWSADEIGNHSAEMTMMRNYMVGINKALRPPG